MGAARDLFERAGFTLTPRADLPSGTSNQLALLNGNFIDLLGTSSPERIPPHRPGRYSTSAQHQDLLSRREGLSFVVLTSDDARLDHETFLAAGLPASEPVDISRPAGQPDGTVATMSLSIVVVGDPKLADAQHFVYQIRTPQYFWHQAYQEHANGALEITEVVLAADEPQTLAAFYRVMFSPGAVHRRDTRLEVETAKGRIVVLPPAELARRYEGIEVAVHAPRPYIAGFQVASRDLDRVESCLRAGAIAHVRRDDVIRLPPAEAFGAVIEFVTGTAVYRP
ncbi:MAG: VOC family protein [Ectothiorhodospiraceae bacterium]|nr:VOC family protein [Ectothiorhodospiraceae bacterium]